MAIVRFFTRRRRPMPTPLGPPTCRKCKKDCDVADARMVRIGRAPGGWGCKKHTLIEQGDERVALGTAYPSRRQRRLAA